MNKYLAVALVCWALGLLYGGILTEVHLMGVKTDMLTALLPRSGWTLIQPEYWQLWFRVFLFDYAMFETWWGFYVKMILMCAVGIPVAFFFMFEVAGLVRGGR